MIKKLAIAVSMASFAVLTLHAQIVASDNFENDNPSMDYDDNAIDYGDNGGSGFGALTYLTGVGGGIYAEMGGALIDDSRSLGIYSNSGSGNTQALGRTISTSVTNGIYSIDARFNVDNSVGFTGFNIKSGLGSTFGANELMSFGLNPGNGNNVFLVTDETGTHTLSVGTDTELRGAAFNFSVSFDTAADTYTLVATDKGNGQMGSISGMLETTNLGPVSAIGFANFNTGMNQNLIADNLEITAVPELSGRVLFLIPALLGAFLLRRRRHA